MREYGLLRLRQAGEEQAAIEAFVDYYAGTCRRAREQAESLQLAEWLCWADLEADNLRKALQHCLRSDRFATGISMVGSLAWYWSTRAASEGPSDGALRLGGRIAQHRPADGRSDLLLLGSAPGWSDSA